LDHFGEAPSASPSSNGPSLSYARPAYDAPPPEPAYAPAPAPEPSYSPPAVAYSAAARAPAEPAYEAPDTAYDASPSPAGEPAYTAYSAPAEPGYGAPAADPSSYGPPEITSYRPPITGPSLVPYSPPAPATSYAYQTSDAEETWPSGPAEFKVPGESPFSFPGANLFLQSCLSFVEFGSYFDPEGFDGDFGRPAQTERSGQETSSRAPSDPLFYASGPEVDPAVPESSEPTPTASPVYYKPLPDETASKRLDRKKDEVPKRPRGPTSQRLPAPKTAAAAAAAPPKPTPFSGPFGWQPEGEKQRGTADADAETRPFLKDFEERRSDFGPFGSDLWDTFDQAWGQKVTQ